MSEFFRSIAYNLQPADGPGIYVVDHGLLARRRKEIMVILMAAIMVLAGGMFYSCGVRRAAEFTWAKKSQFIGEAVVSNTVMAQEPWISKAAERYGISEYVPLLEAVMEQESRGLGGDPMQCSECYYNTEYEQVWGSIEDPMYSIDTGVHYFADCLELAGVKGPDDLRRLKLALQGYNFGTYYIEWALDRDGGYTAENARTFSEMMKQELDWEIYGDIYYIDHVLRYYR